MSNNLEARQEMVLQAMVDVECLPITPELDLEVRSATKIPLSDLVTCGTAFQPIASAIQSVVTGSGGSGIYFVNTKGMQMHATSEGYIGALKTPSGGVGGGQARMTQLPCDPTMLCVAAALMIIEKKLDAIQEVQEEILDFLEDKERAILQGNLNVLGEILTNYKFNWNNEQYKTNKHILVQQIKKEAEASIILYREQIAKCLKKRSHLHTDLDVRNLLKKLQSQFKDYQLALYLYSFSSFLEVLLLGNFSKGFLDSVESRISEYSLQYRSLYTDCYNLMEARSKSSVQSGVLSGLAAASKFMGETIAKVPVISNSQLDESLISAGSRLGKRSERRTIETLEGLVETRMRTTLPFVENIRTVNTLFNGPVAYLFDSDNLYVQHLPWPQ